MLRNEGAVFFRRDSQLPTARKGPLGYWRSRLSNFPLINKVISPAHWPHLPNTLINFVLELRTTVKRYIYGLIFLFSDGSQKHTI